MFGPNKVKCASPCEIWEVDLPSIVGIRRPWKRQYAISMYSTTFTLQFSRCRFVYSVYPQPYTCTCLTYIGPYCLSIRTAARMCLAQPLATPAIIYDNTASDTTAAFLAYPPPQCCFGDGNYYFSFSSRFSRFWRTDLSDHALNACFTFVSPTTSE